MKVKKDIPRQKKALENKEERRLLLLHHWVGIIKAIYPNKITQNPYSKELEELSSPLTIHEILLLKELIHSITLTNKNSRTNEKGEILTNKEDVINALQLLLPKEKQLTNQHLKSLEKLRKQNNGKTFTYQQIGVVLHLSHSSVKRLITVLQYHGLIEKTTHQEGRRILLELTAEKQAIPMIIEEPSPFAIATEEWEDYVGYQNLQYRT